MATLDGKVALVTGAGNGIGRCVAETLARQGARVAVCDIDAESVRETADRLESNGTVFVGDLSAGDAPEQAVELALGTWGRLDIVVNNAGYMMNAPFAEMTVEAMQRMYDVHVLAPFRILKAAVPHFEDSARQEQAEGREVFRKVVNVTSMAGAAGSRNQANYAAAKAGQIGLTKALAKEWGSLRVNVNAVAPGLISTRLTAPQSSSTFVNIGDHQVAVGIPADALDAYTETIPLGRAGRPEECAAVIAFLCGPGSDYMTGQVVNVSGGIAFGMTS